MNHFAKFSWAVLGWGQTDIEFTHCKMSSTTALKEAF
jgi:hypothetical protein